MTSPTSTSAIRLLIVDDHPLLREGVSAVARAQPDIEVVGEAANGAEAIACFRALMPDITLVDLRMPDMSGVDVITAVRAEFPKAKLIVLTTYSGDVQALQAMKAGASGYLLKNSMRLELIEVIRKVHAGQRHVPPEIADDIVMNVGKARLSERELEVLRLVADGHANKEVGRRLHVMEDTVKAHLKSIFGKLGVTDRTHAVTVAARRGIIDLTDSAD